MAQRRPFGSLTATLGVSLLAGLLASPVVVRAGDDSDWCDDLEVHNCSDYDLQVCSYDGDDGLAAVGVQDKFIAAGSSVTMKCNHENCDLRANYLSDYCLGGNRYKYHHFNANVCGDFYINLTVDDGDPDWAGSKSGCPST